MGKVPNSHATINSEMLFKTEDDVLRKFLGQDTQNMFVSFKNYLHPEDEEIFRRALEELKTKAMPMNVVMVRLSDSDKNYCWAAIIASHQIDVLDGKDLFHLHIMDPDDNSEERLEDNINEYSVFLDLLNGILFSYDITTKEVSIFMRNGGQQVMLFSGSLEKWSADMLSGKLDMEYAVAFTSLCRDLEMKRNNFTYRFRTSYFSMDNKMEQCTLKAQLVS